MKVIVIGAGGYIGSALIQEIVKIHHVTAIDRWYFGNPPASCPVERFDIRTISQKHLIGVDAVIDLAGLSNDASAEIDPELTREINEDGGKRLAVLAKDAGVKRYIYSSSASVYGHGAKMYLKETDEVNPLTAYAKSKVAVEDELRKLAGGGFEPVILRNATVFGVSPRMRFDLAVNVMTMRAWKDRTIYIMGGGLQYRPFVHIKDVVNVFCKMLELPADQVSGQTFNVGSDVMNFTISQIASIVKLNFRDATIHQIPDNTDERTYHVSFRKLRDLGIETSSGIEYGIKEIRAALDAGTIRADDPTSVTLAWYRQLIDWDRRLNEIRLDGRIL